MKRNSFLMIWMVLFMLLSVYGVKPDSALACSCAMLQDVQSRLEQKTAVFRGTVTDVLMPGPRLNGTRSSGDLVKVTFTVNEVWKGQLGREVVVYTAVGGESCGYEGFRNRGEFIVFASGETDNLRTTMCDGNQPSSAAGEELAILGDGSPPDSSTQPVQSQGNRSGNSVLLTSAWLAALITIAGGVFLFLRKRRER